MIKVCRNSVSKSLSTIFNDCLNEEESPSEWKKVNTVLFTRKEKKASKNRPTSLLSICIKILEFRNIIYYGMFMLFTDNNLIAQINQDLDLITNYALLFKMFVMRFR